MGKSGHRERQRQALVAASRGGSTAGEGRAFQTSHSPTPTPCLGRAEVLPPRAARDRLLGRVPWEAEAGGSRGRVLPRHPLGEAGVAALLPEPRAAGAGPPSFAALTRGEAATDGHLRAEGSAAPRALPAPRHGPAGSPEAAGAARGRPPARRRRRSLGGSSAGRRRPLPEGGGSGGRGRGAAARRGGARAGAGRGAGRGGGQWGWAAAPGARRS